MDNSLDFKMRMELFLDFLFTQTLEKDYVRGKGHRDCYKGKLTAGFEKIQSWEPGRVAIISMLPNLEKLLNVLKAKKAAGTP